MTLIIYPKNHDGAPIDLDGLTDTAYFRIANRRGPAPEKKVIAGATITSVNGGPQAIVAELSSENGQFVENGFVYDIGYNKDNSRITVLTGTISMVQEVVV